MYSKAAWGGPVDPFILIKFQNETVPGEDDPIVSLVIFEYKDEDFIGVSPNNDGIVWDFHTLVLVLSRISL